MKNASTTSNAGSGHAHKLESSSATSKRRGRTHEYDCLAPPRRRVREARRWLDELYAATTNGLPRNRWPGQRLFMPSEGIDICNTAIAELKGRDPELFKGVEHVIFWDVTNGSGVSVEEFKRQALKRCANLAKIRATMRPREFK